MIIGCIVEGAAGLLCIVLGLIIWIKRKVSLIHEYQYRNVKKAELPAYARLIGISLILIGGGICITGVLNLFESSLWWVPLAAGLGTGFIVMHRAQMKYNGSWLS